MKELLKEYISQIIEMPISKIEKVGNFEKPSGFSKQDLKLLNNPNSIKKINKQWEKTKYDFNVYLLNVPKLNKPEWKEYGELNLGTFSDEDFKKIFGEIPQDNNSITILFNGNSGSEKVPMTGWIMAHRLGHSIRRSRVLNPEWINYENNVKRIINNIIYNVYNKNIFSTHVGQNNQYKRDKIFKYIASQLGTMRSARQNKLRNIGEFYYELFAQYLLTGSIKFNPLPKNIIIGSKPFGRKETISTQIDNLENANSDLEYYASEIESYIESILDSCVGRTFLM